MLESELKNKDENIIVMKFGGSSVADTAAMINVLSIVQNRLPAIVVLSACKGITDKLFSSSHLASVGEIQNAKELSEQIRKHHFDLLKSFNFQSELNLEIENRLSDLCDELDDFLDGISLLGEITPRMTDKAYSFGELLSTTIFEALCRNSGLDTVYFDARSVVVTSSDFNCAVPIAGEISQKAKLNLQPFIDKKQIIITQGFIGADKKGRTTTLGRGGSDFSGAIFGAAVNADEIQIWTDVSGVLSADPRIVKSAFTIPEMTFTEIGELAFFGAKVLHPDTIMPAVENNIAVRVLNTFETNNSGTLIRNSINSTLPQLHSITSIKNCVVCRITYPKLTQVDKFIDQLHKDINHYSLKVLYRQTFRGGETLLCDNSKLDADIILHTILSSGITIEKCSILAIAGVNLLNQSNNQIKDLFDILNSLNSLFISSDYTTGLILCALKTDNIEEIVIKVHNIILKNADLY